MLIKAETILLLSYDSIDHGPDISGPAGEAGRMFC